MPPCATIRAVSFRSRVARFILGHDPESQSEMVQDSAPRSVPTNYPMPNFGLYEYGAEAPVDPYGSSFARALTPNRPAQDNGDLAERALMHDIEVYGTAQRVYNLALLLEHKATRAVQSENGRVRTEDDLDSVVANILSHINHHGHSFREVFAQCLVDRILLGESCVQLVKIASTANIGPDGITQDDRDAGMYEVVRLDPRFVKSEVIHSGDYVEYIYKYKQPDGRVPDTIIPSLTLMLIRNYSLDRNSIRGLPPMTALDNSLTMSQVADFAVARGLVQRNQIDGLIFAETMGSESADEFYTRLRQLARGNSLTTPRLIPVTGSGAKFQAIQAREKDEFVSSAQTKLRENVQNALLVAHGMLDAAKSPEEQREAVRLVYETLILPFAEVFHEHLRVLLRRQISNVGPSRSTTYNTSKVSTLWGINLDLTRTLVAAVNSNMMTPDEARVGLNMQPHDEEFTGEYGRMMNAQILSDLQISAQTAGSGGTTLPGSDGGRDQSDKGEPQMTDESGKR